MTMEVSSYCRCFPWALSYNALLFNDYSSSRVFNCTIVTSCYLKTCIRSATNEYKTQKHESARCSTENGVM